MPVPKEWPTDAMIDQLREMFPEDFAPHERRAALRTVLTPDRMDDLLTPHEEHEEHEETQG